MITDYYWLWVERVDCRKSENVVQLHLQEIARTITRSQPTRRSFVSTLVQFVNTSTCSRSGRTIETSETRRARV